AVAAMIGIPLQLGQHRQVRLDESQPAAGPGDRSELVADAEAGKDAVDLVVEVDRAELRVDRVPSVQDQARDVVLGEQGGGGQAGGACADDDDGDHRGAHGRAPI